jgi:hypothetical protein
MAPAKSARKAATKRRGPRKMTTTHKAALARGREMSTIVDRYLSVVNVPKKRGRRVSPAVLRKRLTAAETTRKSSTGVAKVLAAQEVRDLRARLAETSGDGTNAKTLEASFVKVARQFSVNRGISYAAWRDAGVPAAVLQRAGIARTRA